MPGAAEFLKSGGGSSAPTSGGGAAEFLKTGGGSKPKKKGGLGRLAGSLLGEVGEFISAPQQALFKGVRGGGQIATGDVRQGIGTLGSAGKSAAMFTLPGSSALLEEKAPVTATQALQPLGVKKLPRGLETGLQVVADPLNVATFGVGSLAKQGLKVAGTEAAEKIAKQGLRKGLTAAEKASLRESLVSHAAKEGARKPAKTAARQYKALSARGRGGIGVRIPGTGIGAPIIPGTALGSLGKATGATAAKTAVKGSKPVRALGRGLVPLRAASEAVGSTAAEKLGTAERRRRRSAAALAEDWDKRTVAAKDDYAAQTGKKFEDADDEFVHSVLEAGPEAMAAAKASRPELERVIDTFDAVRREQAEMQRARGLLLSEEQIRAGATARKQAPVRGRMAARDEEINELRTAGSSPDPVPRSAAQERRAGALAERVRRAELTEQGEVARGERLLGQAADEQRKAVARAQKRLDAAKSQEQQTIARFDLENQQRAERAVDKRINQLVERNLRDEDTLARIAQDVLDDPNIITDERYLHRVMTPEGLKALKGIEEEVRRGGGSVSAALNQASLKMRTVAREYTANQINDAIRVIHEGGTVGDVELANAVKGIAQKLNPGEKLYQESATLSLLDRGSEAAKAIAAADFVKELRGIADDTGRSILLSADDVAALKLAGEELPDEFVEFTIGKLGKFHAHKSVKAEISGALGRLEDPDGIRKVFDNLDKWWRSQVTASLPGGIPFATRNARTNVMLMWLSGTNVPKYMREGLKLQRAVSRVYSAHAADVADLGVDAAMRKHLDPRDFKVWDYARKNGVIGDGFYQVDLGGAGAVSKEGGKLRRAVRFGFGTKGAAAVKGRKLNSWIEEHARLSQFLSDVDRYGDLETALHRTQDVLFDYGSLTPTERKIKRWGMPFYTFARKNLPGQVRRFVESPGRVALPEKLAAATTDPLPEGSPEYQARQGSRLSKVPGLLGLVTNPERPLHAAAESLDPLFQLAAGRGQLGLRGAMSNLGGVPGAPAKAIGEQAVGRSLFTGYNLPKAADERQRIALQTAIPSLSRAWPVTTRLSVGAEGRAATEAQRRKLAAPGLAQLLAMAGVNLQPVDEKERKRQQRLARAAKAAERG